MENARVSDRPLRTRPLQNLLLQITQRESRVPEVSVPVAI